MRRRAIAVTTLATLLLSFGLAAAGAQDPHNEISARLSSAKEHAAVGERDAAIADYRKVLSLQPRHVEAIAGLKALGVDDASIAAPLTLTPLDGSASSGGTHPPSPTSKGSGDGGDPFFHGLPLQ